LTSITQGTSVVSLTYDDANRRSTLTLPNGILATYGYDNANQLTSLAYTLNGNPVGDLTYTYDAAGQRTSVGGSFARTGLPQALASATYDAGNRLATWSGQALSYDANGNLASDGLTSYTWDARNQLAAISGATSASFTYDATGRRRARTTTGATSFLYDGANATQELVSGSPTATVMTGGIDEVFQRTDGAGTRAVLTDALGSTVALVDGSGALQTQYTYEPFGATTVSGVASTNPAQFTGRENDGTGLYYYRARYFDPRLQRFISDDPIGFGGGDVNLHAYVGNNPTGYRDPSGHFAPLLVLPVAGCIGGAVGAALGNEMTGRKTTWNDLAGGCAAGTILGLGAWVIGPAIAPAAFAAGSGPTVTAAAEAAAGVSAKIARQMLSRGWTREQIIEAITNGEQFSAINKATGNPATRYVSPTTGQSLVRDNITGDIIHVGGPGFKY
jgi:RHS repeat-associated protein